ncbi:hypothetical protein FRB95_001405 [Tulasnella sp. JGI-2019a]|nr:hypothetical protein FRB95_001405 [Tulasnella sp. JGI-2019a]
MLQLGLPHVNVLSKLDLVSKYGDLDFNLDFYTEVQDLSHLTHALSATHPRFNALTIAICELVEDFGLVGFETLAVEDKESMLHLMRVVDRTLGYAFVASNPSDEMTSSSSSVARDRIQNKDALFSSAMSKIPDAPNVRDVQERWIDSREAYDEWETGEWRREGVAVAERSKAKNKAMEEK